LWQYIRRYRSNITVQILREGKCTKRIAKGVCWGIFVCTIIKKKRSAIYIAYKIQGLGLCLKIVRITPATPEITIVLSNLELGACTLASDGALDQTVGVSLRRVHFSVCAGVLQAVEPAKVCKVF
jgi:hypothetical protein